MSSKLFDPDIPRRCSYCTFCKKSGDNSICSKKNKPVGDKTCHHYSYDPLKRVPYLPPELPVFSAEDFKL